MISLANNDMNSIAVEEEWNFSNVTELLMHTIHAYPAKFPAFIATKAFDYAGQEGVNVKTVADIFCGCGTVALEAKLHSKDFWGCDINPVATLIAKTKSAAYDINVVADYFERIKVTYETMEIDHMAYDKAPERLKYWFTENSFIDLMRLNSQLNSLSQQANTKTPFFVSFHLFSRHRQNG